MRSLVCCLVLSIGCASAPAYRLSVPEQYEVGEDPTIGVAIGKTSSDSAVVVITRPDGSTVRQPVSLGMARTNVRFGGSIARGHTPTFTARGDYLVELEANGTQLARQEIRISVDRLTRMFPEEEIAGFELLARYTRERGLRKQHWKTYGALYEHTLRSGSEIRVVIEDPGDALDAAWKQYEDEGTLGVIENNNVRFRERSGSVSASWISGKKIVAMRAAVLADFQRGFIGRFLARYPSSL
jgi:hypothetical protein